MWLLISFFVDYYDNNFQQKIQNLSLFIQFFFIQFLDGDYVVVTVANVVVGLVYFAVADYDGVFVIVGNFDVVDFYHL